jgi:hypothetical protein
MIKIKQENDLKKKCVIFGLEDVLIPGNVEKDLKMKDVFEILENLQKLEEKFPKFRFFAITGFSADETLKRIEKHCLKGFFPEGRLFFVNQAYLEGREEVDKEIYEKKIKENPEFKDEYFKQVTIQGIAEKFSYKPEEMILVCNDLWTEGYYTMRFSKIEFALIRSAHSSLGQRKLEEIKGLTYINRTWEDIEKLISGKFPQPNYAFLDAFIMNSMKEKLFEGTKLGALNKIARN